MRRALILSAIVAALVLLGGGATVGVVTVVRRKRSGFLAELADEVARQLSELRPDLTEAARARAAQIVAALGALESGYGTTNAYRQGFNFGNVSAGSSWAGPVIGGGDLEYDSNGKVKRITQSWRAYGSLAEAVSDWLRLISWSRYRAARDALMLGDADGFAAGLRAGGYFTAPLAEYQAGLRSALAAGERAA